MKVISILGSTGSIGQSTLDVIRLHKDSFDIFALSCNSNIELLAKQTIEFNPRYIVCKSENDAKKLKKTLPNKIKVTSDDIEKSLDTYNLPNVDLLIRTGGEKRISNFLLWQLAYSELFFVDTLWPDFNEGTFIDAIYFFQNRERRFGKL